jgi:hypothetical protein
VNLVRLLGRFGCNLTHELGIFSGQSRIKDHRRHAQALVATSVDVVASPRNQGTPTPAVGSLIEKLAQDMRRLDPHEAEAQEFSFRRPSHGALLNIDLEFEPLRDESRQACHHSLARSLAAHVDIAIIDIAQKAMAASLQLPIQLVEHQIAQQQGNFQASNMLGTQ